jgi:undecaprenyl-diphosphatase
VWLPQVISPRPSRDTERPERPSDLCCTRPNLVGATQHLRVRHTAWNALESQPVSDFLEAVVLGVIQGLTEFLPISSSAHLRIYPELFGWGDPGAAFTAVIQIGTELAVLLYFRHDIWRILTTWLKSLAKPEYRGHLDARMGWYIIFGTVPIVVLGVLLKDAIESHFRSLWLIGTTLIVLGVVLGVADRVGRTTKKVKDVTVRDALLMGLAQALALVPGVSRSGATLSMGRFLGYEREAATRYAFLLAVPAVIGAGVFELKDVPGSDNPYGWGPTIVATVVSFVVGYAAIAWLLRYVTTRSYTPFVLYRVALGAVTLLLVATGVLAA